MNTRLTNDKHTSLNESISYVNSPQRELDEAVEYALALEEVLLALCEELELDPQALVEDIMKRGPNPKKYGIGKKKANDIRRVGLDAINRVMGGKAVKVKTSSAKRGPNPKKFGIGKKQADDIRRAGLDAIRRAVGE